MQSILAIAWKDIYLRFTDRTLLLIMIAAPLAVSIIVGLAFGGLGEDSAPVQNIPVAILNLDEGSAQGINFGQVYLEVFSAAEIGESVLPACNYAGDATPADADVDQSSMEQLIAPTLYNRAIARDLIQAGKFQPLELSEDDPAFLDTTVKTAVDNGIYHVAVIIPPGLSQSLTALGSPSNSAVAGIEVYANAGHQLEGGVVLSIVEGVTNQILSGNITIAATLAELASRYGQKASNELAMNMDFQQTFGCAFTTTLDTVYLDTQAVSEMAQGDPSSLLLVSVGSAQAMFFALFIAQFGILSMHEEKRNWTLQRMLTTATPRVSILAGKLIGVVVSVLFQLTILFLALSIVGSLMAGQITSIWGNEPLKIGFVMLAAAISVSGLGMLLAGVVKSPEQAAVIASVLNMGLAILGGAFGFFLPKQVAQLSILYWGRDAFVKLAAGGGGVSTNVLVLLLSGAVMFGVGLWLFNRRFEV